MLLRAIYNCIIFIKSIQPDNNIKILEGVQSNKQGILDFELGKDNYDKFDYKQPDNPVDFLPAYHN